MDRAITSPLFVQVRKARVSATHPPFVLDVSLQITAGFTILFGPSGAGKSTLLDCIAGLIRPDAGKIQMNERLLFDSATGINLPIHERNIAYVFQSVSLFPHLTVEENILYGISNLPPAERKRRLEEIVEGFHVASLRNRRPPQISGGEAQRVELARSLVKDPFALLLDEPMTGLDDDLKAEIIEDLRAWRAARGIPILYVTHSRSEAAALGGQMIMLRKGAAVAE